MRRQNPSEGVSVRPAVRLDVKVVCVGRPGVAGRASPAGRRAFRLTRQLYMQQWSEGTRGVGGGAKTDVMNNTTAHDLPARDVVDEIAQGCLAFRVRALGRAVSGVYDRAVARWGLTIAQVNLLTYVGKRGRCTPADLGRAMQMDKSTVSRSVRPLLDAGLLDAEQGEGGRLREIWLAPAGRGRLRSLLPAWRAAQGEVEAMLGAEAVRSVLRIGNKFVFGRADGPG